MQIESRLLVFLLVGNVLTPFVSCKEEGFRVTLITTINEPQVLHRISQQQSIVNNPNLKIDLKDSSIGITIETKLKSQTTKPELYTLISKGRRVIVTGDHAKGVMYGFLDVKEQFSHDNIDIENRIKNPHLSLRTLKFNLPWSAYRSSETLDSHSETLAVTVFWKNFLNMMAQNLFDKFTLWNLHPFNFIVKTEKYPETNEFSDAEMLEWQCFWHTFFKRAKDRGIETYAVNRNIFVPKEFAEHYNISGLSKNRENHYGNGDTYDVIKDFMRESNRLTIDSYPNLTGMGITLGEGIGGMTAQEREEWIAETVEEGARQAKRKIKFIHRAPLSAGTTNARSTDVTIEKLTLTTLDKLTCFEGSRNIELRFNWSHGHSCTDLVNARGGKLKDTNWNPLPSNYHLAWMIRNEDNFILRWGNTDFIRGHIDKNVYPYVSGYYLGAETYIPAYDYITPLKGATYNYAFDRQRMFYRTWGHLLYDPETLDTFLIDTFVVRFPEDGKTLFDAQKKAGRVPLGIASYWDARWDFTLYSEGTIGFNNGSPAVKLLYLETLAVKEPMDPKYLSINQYLDGRHKIENDRISLAQQPDSLNSFCNKSLKEIAPVKTELDGNFNYEGVDIRAWSFLGLYFSDKFKSALAYQRFKKSSELDGLNDVILWLQKAAKKWSKLVTITKHIYEPVPIEHKGYRTNSNLFHWSIIEEEIFAELELLKSQHL